MDMFKAEALDLPGVVSVIERDLPGWIWGVGRCPCGDPSGDYSARLSSPDYHPMAGLISALTGQESLAHSLCRHGRTPEEALARVYGLALELQP